MTFTEITLITNDGHQFTVPREIAELSQFVKSVTMEDDGEDIPEIPIPNVNAEEMTQIIRFCEHYLKNPFPALKKPVKSNNIADHVPEWYSEFVAPFGEPELFSLIMAVNFLHIDPMFDLICATIACSIYDLPPKDVREKFNIPEDISFEELDQQRIQRIWREEHAGFEESDPSIIEYEESKKSMVLKAEDSELVASK